MSRPEPQSDPKDAKQPGTSLEAAERRAEAILAEAEQRARRVVEQAEAEAEAHHAERAQAARTEFDRLAKLRSDVAGGLLEVSKAAERDARRLLSAESDLEPAGSDGPPGVTELDDRPWWSGARRQYGTFAIGLACGFALAVLVRSDGVEVTPPDSSVEVTQSQQAPATAAVPEPVEPAQGAPVASTPRQTENTDRVVSPDRPSRTTSSGSGSSDEIRITLTARETCWVSVQVDDDEAWERLMAVDQTIVVTAGEQARIRVGNAAALTMSINDRPVKPLGAPGQVVNLRITPANYQTFLVGDVTPQPIRAAGRPEPPADASDALRLTLEAKDQCWVRVELDDDEGWERLMAADQTIVVTAAERARVRVGDAAALSMLINDRVVRSLGAQGQVVDLRITQDNYQTFLERDPSRP